MNNGQGNNNGFGGGFPPAQGTPPTQQPPQLQQTAQPPPTLPTPSFTPPATQGPTTGFNVQIDADPTWEPMEFSDVLEQDGYYSAVIANEQIREGTAGKAASLILNLQIQDQDAKGRLLKKFMADPNSSDKDLRWTWRMLILSITGSKDQARSALNYQLGMFRNQTVYFKTEMDVNPSNGRQVTNVASFVTKEEYDQAVRENRHRWKAEAKKAPAGVPGGFPQGGGGGFPFGGADVGAPGAPTPSGAPPMQAGAPSQAQPQGQPVQTQGGFPQQPAQGQPQGGAPQPQGTAPPTGFPPAR